MDVPAVVLYSQVGCADSRRVRRLLRERGVAFVERNATHDADAAAALAHTGIFGTPLLVVADRTVFGYRPAAILRALQDAGVPLTSGSVASPAPVPDPGTRERRRPATRGR